MLRVCEGHFLKPLRWSRRSVGFGRVIVAHLRIRHCPAPQATRIPPLKGIRSSEGPKLTSTTCNRSISRPTRKLGSKQRLRVVRSQHRTSLVPLFVRLSKLLAHPDVSGSALWNIVRIYLSTFASGSDYSFTESQRFLLQRVLQKVLDEWNREGFDSECLKSLPIIRFYARENLFSRRDWVYYLSFLARTAYLNVKPRRDQHAEYGIAERVNDAIRLRILCEAWKLFLLGDAPPSCGNTTSTTEYDCLWPELRDKQAQAQDATNEADYVKNFTGLVPRGDGDTDSDLDRYLSYTSILTLAALYSSMMSSPAVDDINASSATSTHSQGQDPTHEEECPYILQPNWHFGSGQSVYWTPNIGHLSVNEASMLYIIARASRQATLNLTLLRIVLAQISLPDSDAQEIARTYQGFQLAVPAIMSKFQDYTYDELVYLRGRPRRHPFTPCVQKAVASNDVKGLEHAGAVAESSEGAAKTTPMDVLALVKAFLQLDDPVRALRQWKVLTRRVKPEVDAWRVWLDYAFQKKDDVAYSIVWNRLRTLGVSRSSEMWCQRLL